ncbi:MAG: glycosyltransferase family 39 protein [Pirellulales bacterium]|nr:glycosyltransferase family 39 protein [Pirellulales bacterium]
MENSTIKTNVPRFPFNLIGLLLLTFVIRAGGPLVVPGALADDPDGYRRLAENLVEFGTFGTGAQPTAYRPPLYPLLLVPCVALGKGTAATVAIAVLHVLLGLGTVALVWWLGLRCGLGRWAWLAGALVACDPILLGQSTLVMTETAAAFFVALALLALTCAVERPSAVRCAAAGAALGLCGLCRPELLLWAVACMIVLPCVASRRFYRKRHAALVDKPPVAPGDNVRKSNVAYHEAVPESHVSDRFLTGAARFSFGAAPLLIGMVLVLAPWAIRNQIVFDWPIITTTHGGYTLLLANNPSFYAYLREGEPGTVWDARGLGPDRGGHAHHDSPREELVDDAMARREAWANIRRQPAVFAYACLVRVGRFWALAPHQGSLLLRWSVGIWYLAEFVLAAAGMAIGLRRGPLRSGRFWLWGLLLAVSMVAVHAVFWSNMRMRGPLTPVVGLAVAVSVAWWTDRRRKV